MSIVLRIAVIVFGAIYFGLSVLARGGPGPFFSHPPLGAVGLALTVVSLYSSGSLSPGEREDRGNRWVMAVFGTIGVLDAFVPAYTDRLEWWTIDGETARWLGVLLFAGGGALRIRPVFVLGRRFSGLVAIQAGHTLVTRSVIT